MVFFVFSVLYLSITMHLISAWLSCLLVHVYKLALERTMPGERTDCSTEKNETCGVNSPSDLGYYDRRPSWIQPASYT